MNARGKHVDSTYLSLDKAEERGFIHRDYIAHCLRWSHVLKRLAQNRGYVTARLLDVGCGRELPLAKTLYSSRYIVEHYCGVDIGPVTDGAMSTFDSGKFPLDVWENTDICSLPDSVTQAGKFNWFTCFEVLEHVEPEHMLRMLTKIHELTTDDCRYFISTPCWNRIDCAKNHVNEMTYEALGAVFEREGFIIENVYGTFASIRDYEHLLHKWEGPIALDPLDLTRVFNQLREYYDSNFLSCVFAPLFPAQSRNCLWELRKLRPEEDCTKMRPRKLKFKPLVLCQEPWGSSESWKDMMR